MGKQSKRFRRQLITYNGAPNTNQIFKNKVAMLVGDENAKNSIGRAIENEFLGNMAKGYTNIIEFSDPELENIKDFIGYNVFWTGTGCIADFGGKKCVFDVANYIEGANRQIASGTCNLYLIGSKRITKNITGGVNGAFFQSNIGRLGFMVNLKEMFAPIVENYHLIPTELQNAIMKMILFVPEESLKDDTYLTKLEGAFSLQNGMIKVMTGKPLQLQTINTNTINDTLWENINKTINFVYKLRGRKVNISEKSERNLVSEVVVNDEQFDVVIDDYLMYLNKFLEQYNEGTGKNVSVKIKYRMEPQDEGKENGEFDKKTAKEDGKVG